VEHPVTANVRAADLPHGSVIEVTAPVVAGTYTRESSVEEIHAGRTDLGAQYWVSAGRNRYLRGRDVDAYLADGRARVVAIGRARQP
jgi:hypothetical protein